MIVRILSNKLASEMLVTHRDVGEENALNIDLD